MEEDRVSGPQIKRFNNYCTQLHEIKHSSNYCTVVKSQVDLSLIPTQYDPDGATVS